MSEPFPGFVLSQACAEWAIQVKRKSGLKQWNEVCRIAFCYSLSLTTIADRHKSPESNVEMSWKTFGGPRVEIYTVLLKHAATKYPPGTSLQAVFYAHLARGLHHLAAQEKGLPPAILKGQAQLSSSA